MTQDTLSKQDTTQLLVLPLMQVPFERIGMDLVGPLDRYAGGHRFALVLVDYATR